MKQSDSHAALARAIYDPAFAALVERVEAALEGVSLRDQRQVATVVYARAEARSHLGGGLDVPPAFLGDGLYPWQRNATSEWTAGGPKVLRTEPGLGKTSHA